MPLIVPGRSTLIRFVPVLLMALGLGLLLYVGFQYGQMYFEQRRLAREWERQQTPAAEITENTPDGMNSAVANDGLTRLSIPKISLDAVIVEGTSRKALLLGPGHLKESAEPGQPGNAVITAHRDTFFRHIYELNKGDVVTVQRSGKKYTYQVTGKKIVDPNDVSVLRPSDEHRLTLITCYPTYYIGPAPERLVIFSKLAEASDRGSSQGPPLASTASSTTAK